VADELLPLFFFLLPFLLLPDISLDELLPVPTELSVPDVVPVPVPD